MATNKNATIRYQTLDRCFRNPGRNYYIDDLIDACNDSLLDFDPASTGIKRRQIFDDIKFMKDSLGFNAPIESYKDGKKVYYRYDDLNFSINNQPLNEKEAQQLKEALLTLSRFKGMPQFEWVEEMQLRLEHSFHLQSDKKVIEFEENIYLKGREFIGHLYNSIIQHQSIIVNYQPFKGEMLHVIVSPYYLKEYNNRWFLFAFNHQEEKLMILALDRIEKIEVSKDEFLPNIGTDFEEYFEDLIGVSLPENAQIQKVILKVDSQLWPYIETKPIHGSQKMKEKTSDYVIVELNLIPNFEMEALIFSHAEKIEVLSPETLRQQFKNRSEILFGKYN